MLERGRDELLLANYTDLRPLYIKKGRKYIANFLKAASELGSYKKITDVFPHEINLLDTLLNHGIIVPYGFKRDSNFQKPSEKLEFGNRKSMSLYLLISQSCNMGCVYCLNGTKTYKKDKNLLMSKEIAFRSVERCLDSLISGGRLQIIFFGGEPLLNWPLAKEIIIYCENYLKGKYPEKKIKYHITSNLSLFPTDLIEWARRFNITFLCDIDGPEKIHNICRPFKDGRSSHQTITRNVKHLVAAGLKVDLRATITALNQDHLLEITKHHKAIGGKSSAFVTVNPVNSDEVILSERLLPSPQKVSKGMVQIFNSKIWETRAMFPFNQYASTLLPGAKTCHACGAPYGNTPVVDVNGAVFPCIYLVGIKRFYLGNVLKGNYPDKEVLNRMYNLLHVDQREQCQSCSWRYMCGGGCPIGRLTVLDNPLASKKVRNYCNRMNCEMVQTVLQLLLWDKAKDYVSKKHELLGHSKLAAIGHTIYC